MKPQGDSIFPEGNEPKPKGKTLFPLRNTTFPKGNGAKPEGKTDFPLRKMTFPEGNGIKPKGKMDELRPFLTKTAWKSTEYNENMPFLTD